MKKTIFLGYYSYWVILTYLSVISATVGIYYAFNSNIKHSILCLIISGICDMFDGTVARKANRTETEKKFGIQIDSLADIISFAILPAVIGYSLFTNEFKYNENILIIIFTILILSGYNLAALTRLAYFNVTEEEFQGKNIKRKFYEGLPVTSVSMILPAIYSIFTYFKFYPCEIYIIALMIIAILFILKVKVSKLKLKSIGFIGFIIALITSYFFIKI